MSSQKYLNHCEDMIIKTEDKILRTMLQKKVLGDHRIINENMEHFIKVRNIYCRIRDQINRDHESE